MVPPERNLKREFSDPQSAIISRRKPRKLVLCFDGTGNKFCGTHADSNIVKMYRMLDRSSEGLMSYYQPGIGTYVTSSSLSQHSKVARIKSWYMKSKDQAVGTSFGDHVMGGYKFLMRYYNPGDEIYMLGFSRGAYTARFLAEMIDHIGILSSGNEEMLRFAWKTFQKWQTRHDRTELEKREKKKLLDYMLAFRETFSRPIYPRIRFLGLFDTVNSVPTFENAWMKRSKFPYTARSTAKVVRHAVSIDERRAKFRQDLISEVKHTKEHEHGYLRGVHHIHHKHHQPHRANRHERANVDGPALASRDFATTSPHRPSLAVPTAFRDRSETSGIRSLSPSRSPGLSSITSYSDVSLVPLQREDDAISEDGGEQDIEEVWFAGGHGDLGGGWPLAPFEEFPASHIPLVWMVREARRAGLPFDEVKVAALNCWNERDVHADQKLTRQAEIPSIDIQPASPPGQINYPIGKSEPAPNGSGTDTEPDYEKHMSPFHRNLHSLIKEGRLHDSLRFSSGSKSSTVVSYVYLSGKIREHPLGSHTGPSNRD
ncbi:MAG: hypothetical protein M1820_008903 [Bogoriella megaspora]|nr:MAG: hypothetical protein M1820_008903 [Bogoriella megaspora]